MNNLKILVALYAYDELSNLKLLLPKLKKLINEKYSSIEIKVIGKINNDDQTVKFCNSLGIEVISRKNSNSFGDATRTAFDHAFKDNYDWVITMDSDGQHNISYIKDFYNLMIKNNHDLIIGSRYIQGGNSNATTMSIAMSKLLNLVYRTVLGLNIKDLSNNFRCYRVSTLRNISFEEHNFEILEEVVVKLFNKNPDLKVFELPITLEKRISGDSKRDYFSFLQSFIRTLIKLKIKY